MTGLNKNVKKAIGKLLPDGTDDIPCVDDFKARRFGKSELARLYNLTVDGLRKRMRKKSGLMEELESIGYDKNENEFTKNQVKIIIKYLGEPFQ